MIELGFYRINWYNYRVIGQLKELETTMDFKERITFEPNKKGGKPCVRNLRITVYDVLQYLASGMSHEEILADFPDLAPEDIRACLAFAAEREKRLAT